MENLLKFVQESREVRWNKMNTEDLEEGSKNQVKYVRHFHGSIVFSNLLHLLGKKSS